MQYDEFENAYPNLTPRALQALAFGKADATAQGDSVLSSAHLLAGLVRLDSGVTATMLKRLDIDLALIRDELRKSAKGIPFQHSSVGDDNELNRILASAAAMALKCGGKPIGTEHLFYTILSDEDCDGAVLLRALGVENTTLRDEINRELFGL